LALTDTSRRNTKSREKPYNLSDGKGLYLLVKPDGSKLWCLKYRFNDTERKLSFGTYPEVMRATARERQLDARRLLEGGIDPGVRKKQVKRAALISTANSFEAVAREWFVKFSSGWVAGHSCKVLLRIEDYLFPWLGSRPIMAV
jgi:hypothetical protein